MTGQMAIARALFRWVRRWQRPEAERDSDGSGWILRHSRAYLVMAWCLAAIPALLFGCTVMFVVTPPPDVSRVQAVLLCSFFTALLPVLLYYVAGAYRLAVRFDEEGFTLERLLFKPVRVAWGEVQSVRLSSDEVHLILGKERGGSVKVPVHVHGLGRFVLYLETFAPVWLPADVREVSPLPEPSPDQTPASPAE